MEANEVDPYTPIDPRYQLGYCGNCTLRGKVPLVWGTLDEVQAIVTERKDKELRKEEMQGLRVGRIPYHPRTPGCCEGEDAKRTHLTEPRLAQLRAIMHR